MYQVIVVGILALACGIQAQIASPCHANIFDFTSRHSLVIPEYMGDWYMHEIGSSFINGFPQPDYKCAKRTYSIVDPEDLTNLVGVDSLVDIASGTVQLDNKTISVNATRSPLSSLWSLTASNNETTKLIVIAADLEFQQWTVQYSCSIRGPLLFRYEVVTAMTRSRTITPEMRNNLKAIMVGLGFRIGDQHSISQEDCDN